MGKENAFYFSHDYNARNDRKIASLVKDYKSSGYGIYWCTVEMLHEEGGQMEFDDITFDAIAKDLNEANEAVKEVLQKCIDKYKLLHIVDNTISAHRVKQNLSFSEAKKEIKRNAGKKGGINSGKSRRYNKDVKQNEALLQKNEADEKKNEANEPNEMKLNEMKLNDKEDRKEKEGLPPHPPPESMSGFQYLPDGRSYIERTVFYTSKDFNGLPENVIKSAKDLIKVVKKVEVPEEDISTLWESFKTLGLTFQKPYRNKDDVYGHFVNWTKGQPFSKGKPARELKTEKGGKYQKEVKTALSDYKPTEYDK